MSLQHRKVVDPLTANTVNTVLTDIYYRLNRLLGSTSNPACVNSLNELQGDVTLMPGSNVSLQVNTQKKTITINAASSETQVETDTSGVAGWWYRTLSTVNYLRPANVGDIVRIPKTYTTMPTTGVYEAYFTDPRTDPIHYDWYSSPVVGVELTNSYSGSTDEAESTWNMMTAAAFVAKTHSNMQHRVANQTVAFMHDAKISGPCFDNASLFSFVDMVYDRDTSDPTNSVKGVGEIDGSSDMGCITYGGRIDNTGAGNHYVFANGQLMVENVGACFRYTQLAGTTTPIAASGNEGTAHYLYGKTNGAKLTIDEVVVCSGAWADGDAVGFIFVDDIFAGGRNPDDNYVVLTDGEEMDLKLLADDSTVVASCLQVDQDPATNGTNTLNYGLGSIMGSRIRVKNQASRRWRQDGFKAIIMGSDDADGNYNAFRGRSAFIVSGNWDYGLDFTLAEGVKAHPQASIAYCGVNLADGTSSQAYTGSIDDITLSNPCKIESDNHGLVTGTPVILTSIGGTTELNDRTFTVLVTGSNDFFYLIGEDATGHTTYTTGGTWSVLTNTITNISQATPAVVTTSAEHGLWAGARIKFTSVGGMVEINGGTYEVLATPTTKTFTIQLDTTYFTPYTTGGTWTSYYSNCAGIKLPYGSGTLSRLGWSTSGYTAPSSWITCEDYYEYEFMRFYVGEEEAMNLNENNGAGFLGHVTMVHDKQITFDGNTATVGDYKIWYDLANTRLTINSGGSETVVFNNAQGTGFYGAVTMADTKTLTFNGTTGLGDGWCNLSFQEAGGAFDVEGVYMQTAGSPCMVWNMAQGVGFYGAVTLLDGYYVTFNGDTGSAGDWYQIGYEHNGGVNSYIALNVSSDLMLALSSAGISAGGRISPITDASYGLGGTEHSWTHLTLSADQTKTNKYGTTPDIGGIFVNASDHLIFVDPAGTEYDLCTIAGGYWTQHASGHLYPTTATDNVAVVAGEYFYLDGGAAGTYHTGIVQTTNDIINFVCNSNIVMQIAGNVATKTINLVAIDDVELRVGSYDNGHLISMCQSGSTDQLYTYTYDHGGGNTSSYFAIKVNSGYPLTVSDGYIDTVNIKDATKLYFDASGGIGSDTYIYQSVADVLTIVVGGDAMMNLNEGTTNNIEIVNCQLRMDAGYQICLDGNVAASSNCYILYDSSPSARLEIWVAGAEVSQFTSAGQGISRIVVDDQVRFAVGAADGSSEGDVWYNHTAHTLQYRDNAGVKTVTAT